VAKSHSNKRGYGNTTVLSRRTTILQHNSRIMMTLQYYEELPRHYRESISESVCTLPHPAVQAGHAPRSSCMTRADARQLLHFASRFRIPPSAREEWDTTNTRNRQCGPARLQPRARHGGGERSVSLSVGIIVRGRERVRGGERVGVGESMRRGDRTSYTILNLPLTLHNTVLIQYSAVQISSYLAGRSPHGVSPGRTAG